MNKLYELIQQLCPDGVKYKKFGNVCQYIRGITYSKPQEVKDNSTNAWKVMRANNITLGSNVINFEDVKLVKREVYVRDNQLLKKGDILICAGSGSKEHIGKVAYIFDDMEYTFGGFMAVIRCGNELNSRFLFHILTGNSFSVYLSQALNSTTINNLNVGIMKNYLIPVPPLEVQQEIVRILDHFTELTTELTTELAARKEQYIYYRNRLLAPTSQSTWMTLGDIGKVAMCKRIMKAETSPSGDVPFYKIGTFGKEPDAYISKAKYEEYRSKYSFPKKGDILISAAGTIGRTVIYDGEPAYYQDSNIVWVENDESIVLNRYLYYYYQLQPWSVSTGGTIARLYNDNISKARISVPPLPEQRRIVAILDRFDALCNDLTSGLPAEIAARQKQYEYYRDKLLTFKKREG